ncbi:MAG: T9SS type A sorting domain-containing protein [Chitinophagales bacterium]|nr:T9SS type A sorting domain-containing protein [Chitinophagales bacterium]
MIKNYFLLAIICKLTLLITQSLPAQIPGWNWAQSVGGTKTDVANAITSDPEGNILMVGYFESPSIIFGSDTLSGSSGTKKMFLAKYDSSGNLRWAKTVGQNAEGNAKSVATDTNGNIYVSGYFSSQSITFGNSTYLNQGQWDMFLVKFAPDGQVLWSVSTGGPAHDDGLCVAVDATGNVVVAGYFKGATLTFGSTVLTSSSPSISLTEMFVAKFDTEGQLKWAKSAGGNNYDQANSAAIDTSGNIILAGTFSSSTMSFGNLSLSNSSNLSEAFLAKYDPDGEILWARNAAGANFDDATSVTVNQAGDIFVAGKFYSTTLSFGNLTISNAGADDIFLVKYNADGNPVWAKSIGGDKNDSAKSVFADKEGNVLLAGGFQSTTIAFGSTIFTNVSAFTNTDLFLAKFNSAGNVLWAKSVGGEAFEIANGLTINKLGHIYIAGEFSSNALSFSNTTISTAGVTDIFIASIGETTNTIEIPQYQSALVFPNPTTGPVFYLIRADWEGTNIFVWDVLGKLRITEPITNQFGQIDLTGLENGVFVLSIQSANKVLHSQKLIIRD